MRSLGGTHEGPEQSVKETGESKLPLDAYCRSVSDNGTGPGNTPPPLTAGSVVVARNAALLTGIGPSLVANLSGDAVDLTVNLTNTEYFQIPFDVYRVELWRRRETEEEFTLFKRAREGYFG